MYATIKGMWILDQQASDRQGGRPNFRQIQSYRRDLRKRLVDRDGRACVWCGGLGKEVTMDHVIPDSFGGPLTSYNLIPACRSCNSARGNKSALVWYRTSLDKGYEPNVYAIVAALRDGLLYGDVTSKYSLYDITQQLQSPEFSEVLFELGGAFAQAPLLGSPGSQQAHE